LLIANVGLGQWVYHAPKVREPDSHHGGVLIIWDWLFGALSSQVKQEPPVYGLTSNLATCHPCIVLSHEFAALWQDFKRADNWRDKLTYLLLAPGWRHDGPVKRARVLRTRAALATGRFTHAL